MRKMTSVSSTNRSTGLRFRCAALSEAYLLPGKFAQFRREPSISRYPPGGKRHCRNCCNGNNSRTCLMERPTREGPTMCSWSTGSRRCKRGPRGRVCRKPRKHVGGNACNNVNGRVMDWSISRYRCTRGTGATTTDRARSPLRR